MPPRQLEPRVPHDLETICLKCLEKDPARRFASAAELADDLRRFVDGDPILARPTPAWERAWKWGKRRPAIVALLGVSTLAVLGMVLFIVWHNVSLRGKLDVALAEERLARQREQDALEEQRLSLVQQEGQKLFDGARVAVAASDWPDARLRLEKALTTIGGEARLEDAEGARPGAAEAGRAGAARRGRPAGVAGPAPAVRRACATRPSSSAPCTPAWTWPPTWKPRATSVQQALAVYGVSAGAEAAPDFDAYLDDAQKAEILADCYQLC